MVKGKSGNIDGCFECQAHAPSSASLLSGFSTLVLFLSFPNTRAYVAGKPQNHLVMLYGRQNVPFRATSRLYNLFLNVPDWGLHQRGGSYFMCRAPGMSSLSAMPLAHCRQSDNADLRQGVVTHEAQPCPLSVGSGTILLCQGELDKAFVQPPSKHKQASQHSFFQGKQQATRIHNSLGSCRTPPAHFLHTERTPTFSRLKPSLPPPERTAIPSLSQKQWQQRQP